MNLKLAFRSLRRSPAFAISARSASASRSVQTPAHMARLLLAQAAGPIIAGTIAGLASAVALGRVLASLLYGVSATDPLSLLAAAAILSTVALAASYFSVRRAIYADPAASLRD